MVEPIDPKECKQALTECGVLPADLLVRYMMLLLEINQTTNLTGAKTPKDFALKHIADVWGAYNALGGLRSSVLDIGSGGGLPGIALAIFSPTTEVTLVERRQKKASALSEIVSKLGLDRRVKVVAKSFEEVKAYPKDAELWFRGFLPGPKLATYFSQFFPHADLGPIVLMKGPGWSEEKLAIMDQPKVKQAWKERVASADEIEYRLPQDAGERLLVLV